MDQLLFVRPLLDTASRLRLGSLSNGTVALDPVRRLDVAIERAVGLGSLSLRALGIPPGIRLGMGTRLRLTILES